MSSSMSFQDVATITLAEADLTKKTCGEFHESPKRVVIGSCELQWWIRIYPAGETAADKGHAGVYLWVNKLVKAKCTFSVDSISNTFTHEFPYVPQRQGWPRFASHSELRPFFRDGKVTVTCSVEFNVKPPKPTVKDCTTLMLREADLTGKAAGEFINTPKRTISYLDGFEWWIKLYPAGHQETDKGYISIFLNVNKPVTANYKFVVDGSSISCTATSMFSGPSYSWGFTKYASHDQLRPLFHDGKANITCDVEFEIPDPQAPTIPRLYQICSNPTNYTLEVGSKKLEVHREYLSLVSPVFHAMLPSGKSKSRKMKIPNLEYDAVKAAIDFCYGRELHDKSAETYLGILRFAKKYKIDAVVAEVERFLMLNLSVDSVSSLMRYELCLDKCVQFFKENEAKIKKTEKFLSLPPAVVIRVLKAAFELNTDFALLQYAHSHDYEFIIDELEKRLLTSMTIDDFGPIVSYAWDNDRDDLKKACAKFCAGNCADIVKMNNFSTLSAETIVGVMKLAFGVKQEMP